MGGPREEGRHRERKVDGTASFGLRGRGKGFRVRGVVRATLLKGKDGAGLFFLGNCTRNEGFV